jgi:peptide/nickel transport system permease protein
MTVSLILRRLLLGVPVVLGVTIVTFLLVQVSARGYVPGYEADFAQPGDLDRLRHSLGLDRPLYEQYLSWLWGLVHLDFGRSLVDNSPIIDDILARLPNTLLLSSVALLLGLALAIPLGVVSAYRRGSKLDSFLTVVSVAGFAIPEFWLALLLILVFSVTFASLGLPALPSSGSYDPIKGGGLGDRVVHLIMPAATLAFVNLSVLSRYIRSSMITALSADYVRTARSKGLTERRVLYRHALRNALIPVITLIGLWIPRLVSGSLVVEVVFTWPGVGRFIYDRAVRYDYTTVLAITTIVSVMVVLGNVLADIALRFADPRVRD